MVERSESRGKRRAGRDSSYSDGDSSSAKRFESTPESFGNTIALSGEDEHSQSGRNEVVSTSFREDCSSEFVRVGIPQLP